MSSPRRTRSTSTQFHKVHKYFVGNAIAKGSFSCIYSAYRCWDYTSFAVKMISKRKFKCCNISEYIFGEKVIAPLLNHPHILHIYEIIESAGQLFQVQDLYENGDLLSYVIQCSPSRSVILRLIDEVLSAIEYMHSLHLCHRDIKPENVLLTNEISAKLTDFGFTSFSINHKNCSKCGSYGYTAPEVVNSDSYDGQKADIWSIGVFIYTLFAKKCPFDDSQMANSKTNDISKSIVTKLDFSKVPGDVAFLIKQCLNKDPSLRPTVTEIRESSLFEEVPRQADTDVSFPDVSQIIENPDSHILSRISEFLGKPIYEIENEISCNEINESKIFYYLINSYLKDNKFSIEHESVFHSLPETTCGSLASHQFDVQEELLIDEFGYKVDEALNELLLPRKFCVATSINGEKSIVLNLPGDDIYLDLSVIDNQDKKSCRLLLSGNAPSDILDDLTCLIKNKFSTSP